MDSIAVAVSYTYVFYVVDFFKSTFCFQDVVFIAPPYLTF